MRLSQPSGIEMKMGRLTAVVAALTVTAAATASTTESAPAAQPLAPSLATSLTTTPSQIPLLYVVDGVRYERGKIPVLSRNQIFTVHVIKGHAALEQYGPDASYGVVVITTRQAVGPQA
jgi:hypothetical protein